ncbi:MAG TPA: glycosyltransferase family 2 protein [Intrasporangium sp.]|uniref:glycosyltransferase family 2 protein n=1 Tax=Intrasporangium sp. TaxID=1925024 RepID=UPI002B459A6E|nr:glycosyltransferase family 2 protein [Intrasporangium sp.]HKX65707.1 glycosyltransferase family 2 protein [Intrasporangium sp.]
MTQQETSSEDHVEGHLDSWPAVSVIIPVLNEEGHLAEALAMVLGQDYQGETEVVVALGPSHDGTEAIARQLQQGDPRIVLVDNPSGRTPDGLNAAIAASRHGIIARVDGHAEIPADYLRRAVTELRRVGADNVGGIMDAQGSTSFQRAVACAMKSRLGVGNARFHVGGQAGEAETVYLGVFRRSALERVGGYDPHFSRAQDWEMNHRIRSTGGTVWFTPQLRVIYRPRTRVRDLARQYFHYGRWRRVVARQHVGTINARYLAAPTMVVATTVALVAGSFWPAALLLPVAYLGAVTVGGLVISTSESPAVRIRTPLVLAVMHWSWGVGFLSSTKGSLD